MWGNVFIKGLFEESWKKFEIGFLYSFFGIVEEIFDGLIFFGNFGVVFRVLKDGKFIFVV